MAVGAFGFGVGGHGLVGRCLCMTVWVWWVGVSQWSLCMRVRGWWVGIGHERFGLLGLGWVGWGRSGVVCAGEFGVGGLGVGGLGLLTGS